MNRPSGMFVDVNPEVIPTRFVHGKAYHGDVQSNLHIKNLVITLIRFPSDPTEWIC